MAAPSPKNRFWWLYFAAWLPLLVGNAAITFVEGDVDLATALRRSIAFVLPGVVLGIAIVKISPKLPRVSERPLAFSMVHLGLSGLFAVSYSLGVMGCRWLDGWLMGTEVPIGLAWFVWFLISGLMIYGAVASVGYGLETARLLHREEARVARAEALRTEAELTALRAQLNPHFLFNTLHSLLALVRHDPDHAEEALDQFGDLLRYTLRIQRETVDEVPLAEEWAFVENYLDLERLRLGERLRLETEIEPRALAWRVPVFSLQPLVENAIEHAVAPRASGGRVHISALIENNKLKLEVTDDGPGADPENLGSGMGLGIIRQRLEVLSRGRGQCHIETAEGQGFTVQLLIPQDLSAAEEN